MSISVLGLGYIGLPTAIILADAGHEVFGFDVNKEVVNCLRNGDIHIVENNLLEAYQKVFNSGKLKVYSELQPADVYIISVPTPFKENHTKKEADLSYVLSATKEISKVLKKGDLVILESTVPPYTTKLMTDVLENESGLNRKDFFTAHCPERVLPGNILFELRNNDRIIGSENEEAANLAKEIYDSFLVKGKNYITDDVTAEMAKLVENSFRDVNIAFANELSIICDKAGIDVFKLIELANKHPRVNILSPGVGVGGHCIAIDPWFIIEKFSKEANLLKLARETNDNKPLFVAEKVEQLINFDKNITIGVLGLSYKPDIDDLRESPSIEFATILKERGYKVIGCEPNIAENTINNIKNYPLEEMLETADFFVITLAHKEFTNEQFKKKIENKRVYSCVGNF